MRPVSRISDTLNVLEQAWRKYPDQRLGQLILNACRGESVNWPDVFNVEDDRMLKALEELLGREPRKESLTKLIDEDRAPSRHATKCDECGEEMYCNMMGMGLCPNGHERNPLKKRPKEISDA